MSSSPTTKFPEGHASEDGYLAYRTLAWSSAGALALAVVSLLGFLMTAFLMLALIGLLLSLHAIVTIRNQRDHYVGMPLAVTALSLCLFTLIGASGMHTFIYMTEVLEDHTRVLWRQLQPDDPRAVLPSEAALRLDGESIFIKGYLYPDGQQTDITEFILVPDMGTCCFGGNPALTDMILVTLENPEDGVNYNLRRRKLHGTFRVTPVVQPLAGEGMPSSGGIFYRLEATHIR